MNGGDTMHDDQQSIDDLAAAYALDALTPEERARFEAGASPEARREAAQFADTATLFVSDEVAPPAGLRASILDAIAAESRASGASPEAPSTSPALTAVPDDAGAPTTRRTAGRRLGPAERRARARWQPLRLVGAVAAGAALLVGGITIGTQLGGASQQEELGAVVAAADAQRSEVELADGASATVIWSPELGRSVLLFDGLQPAPDGSAYQAWYVDASGPRSAGVFQADGGSTAVLLEGDMDAGVAVGVTVEPASGSEAPTTEPLLVVQT